MPPVLGFRAPRTAPFPTPEQRKSCGNPERQKNRASRTVPYAFYSQSEDTGPGDYTDQRTEGNPFTPPSILGTMQRIPSEKGPGRSRVGFCPTSPWKRPQHLLLFSPVYSFRSGCYTCECSQALVPRFTVACLQNGDQLKVSRSLPPRERPHLRPPGLRRWPEEKHAGRPA